MANQKHLAILMQGVEVWNQWRKKLKDVQPDLSGADLSGADLSGADLSGANLSGANLYGANLSYVNLSGANLIEAVLIGANLIEAVLIGVDLRWAYLSSAEISTANPHRAGFGDANLSEADLHRANLSHTNFSHINLSHTNLKDVVLYNTIFADIDLRSVKGLVEVDHQGPSIVQLHTVKLPQDGSAVHFLRGTGLPDEWIDFYRATMMQPIVYHSVFISYSGEDEDIAKRLHADLQNRGVRCWFAPHDLKPGDYFRKGIDEAIHMQDKFLLILSEHSVESGWVNYEVETALAREIREQRNIMFPLHIDQAVMTTPKTWAVSLRETRHIGDFTHWKQHDDYQQAFTRLLRDLKAESKRREL